MQIRLKNFQSHKDSTLDLAPFTVIVGHSSSGKSAIVRALKTLLYNLPSKGFIRKGAKSLEIEFNDGMNTILYKRDASVHYTVHNKELSAVGRDQLEAIGEMGYSPIDIDKKKYYPQISGQWDSPFLISFSDSEISKIMASLSQAGLVKSAKGRMVKDSSEMANTLSIRQIDREAVQTQLVSLGDVETSEMRLNGLLECRNKVLEAERRLARVVELKNVIDSCRPLSVPVLPEDFRPLLKLYDVVRNAGLSKPSPDTEKLKNALLLLSSLTLLKNDIDCTKLEGSEELHKEAELLKTEIHLLNETCPECGQILPKNDEKTFSKKIG